MQSVLQAPEYPRARRSYLDRVMLLYLIAAACIYRVWVVFQSNPLNQRWSDAARHWQEGINPLDAAPMSAIDPVGFQIYLGMLGKLTVGSAPLIAWWTSLLSIVGPWLWYRFLRELLPSRNLALVGWLILALLPSWVAIYSYFMQETLMLPLLGAALWATWRCRRKGDVASFVVAVVMWLFAGLTRGICLPLGAVAMTWLWWMQGGKPRRALLATLVLAMALVPLAGRSWSIARVISPYGIGQLAHLYQISGTRTISLEFTRGGGREHWTYEFVSPSVNHPPFAPLSDWGSPREWDTHIAIDLDAGNRDWQAARDRLPAWTISRALRLTGENLIHLFFGASWPDSDTEGGLRRDVGRANYLMRWIWAPLTVVCVLATLKYWHRLRETMLLPAIMSTWFIVQGLIPLSLNEGRYRKPFEGLLVAQCLLLLGGRRQEKAAGAANRLGDGHIQ